MIKSLTLSIAFISISYNAIAQIGIGTNSPDRSAALEITGEHNGLLIPRVRLTGISDVQTIAAPAHSLIVYNLQQNAELNPGYYYWDNSKTSWIRIQDSDPSKLAWRLSGNVGTVAGTDFIGTNDNVDLVFKRNNVLAGFLNNSHFNTAYGVNSFGDSFLSNRMGEHNTAIGHNSLSSNLDGKENTAVGASSLKANSDGSNNTAVGVNSLLVNNMGSLNVAVGHNSLKSNETGYENTAIGAQ